MLFCYIRVTKKFNDLLSMCRQKQKEDLFDTFPLIFSNEFTYNESIMWKIELADWKSIWNYSSILTNSKINSQSPPDLIGDRYIRREFWFEIVISHGRGGIGAVPTWHQRQSTGLAWFPWRCLVRPGRTILHQAPWERGFLLLFFLLSPDLFVNR